MRTLSAFMVLSLLVCGCADEKASTEQQQTSDASKTRPVIAKIDSEKVYKDEFQSWYNVHKRRFRTKGVLDKKKARKEYIQFRMIVKKAREDGYHKKPSVQQIANRAMVRLYMMDKIHKKLRQTRPSESEMKRYFKENKVRFSRPELKRFSVIMMHCQDKGPNDTCKDKMNQLSQQVSRTNFSSKVKELSEERYSKRRSGDIGFSVHPSVPKWRKKIGVEKKALAEAFSLSKRGSLSKPILVGQKVYLFMLTGHIPSYKVNYRSQKGRIKSALLKERKKRLMDSFFASIRSSFQVTHQHPNGDKK